MAERIQVLTPFIDDCPAFVVDTTGPLSVELVNAAAPVVLWSADGVKTVFVGGDNFQVLSLGYYLPERFVMYEPKPVVGLMSPCVEAQLFAYKMVSLADVELDQFGVVGKIKIPFPNYETPVGVFIDASTQIGDEPFRLEIKFPFDNGVDIWRVSMVNVPPQMNGVTFHIVPFVKVMHNFDLI